MTMSGSLQVSQLQREFVDAKTNATYSDPNNAWTPDQVKDFLANQYPHLTNAKIEGPEILTSKVKYKFVTTVGTKG
jgi:PRTRC genetic system protein C